MTDEEIAEIRHSIECARDLYDTEEDLFAELDRARAAEDLLRELISAKDEHIHHIYRERDAAISKLETFDAIAAELQSAKRELSERPTNWAYEQSRNALRESQFQLAELVAAANRVVGAYTLSVYPPTSRLVTDGERHDSMVALHAILRALSAGDGGEGAK